MTAPRTFTHRGMLDADGLFLTHDQAQRLMTLWRPGDVVHHHAEGWVLRFGTPRPLRAECAPGTPLVRSSGRLVAAPLRVDEIEGPHDAVLLISGGQVVVLATGKQVDLADLLTWDVELVQPAPLAPPPSTARPVAPQVEGPLRDLFPGVGPLHPDLQPAAPADGVSAHTALTGLTGTLRRLLDRVRGLFSPATPAQSAGTESGEIRAGVPSEPGWLSRLLTRLGLRRATRAHAHPATPAPTSLPSGAPAPAPDGWLSRLLRRVRSRSHMANLRQLLRDLEGRRWEDALRRALPLGGDHRGPHSTPSWQGPRTRDQLTFTRASTSSPGELGIQDETFDRLKQLYQQAARDLERKGRIEEAAFVLGELLDQPLEALELLERHERWSLAAKLAEAKDLPPEVTARMYLYDGELEHALALVRRRGGYRLLIDALEGTDDAMALRVRVAWFARLAASGAYAAALAVIPRHMRSNASVRPFLDRAIASGGPRGAEILIDSLADFPETWTKRVEQLQPYLTRGQPHELTAMARRLIGTPLTPQLRAVGTSLLRRLRQHLAVGELDGDVVPRLESALGDPLSIDAPAQEPPGSGPRRTRERHLSAQDCGTRHVWDVHLLDDGHVLVALGESGVELWHPAEGRQRRWDTPTHHLVPVLGSPVVLLVTARGEVQVVHRLSTATDRIERLRTTGLTSWADHATDLWFVVEGDRLCALDLAQHDLPSLWSVPVPRCGSAPTASEKQVSLLVDDQIWCFDHTPRIKLRSRASLEHARGAGHHVFQLGADGLLLRWNRTAAGWTAPGVDVALPLTTTPPRAHLSGSHLVAASGARAVFVQEARLHTTWHLEGATHVVTRQGSRWWGIADDLGRVCIYSKRSDACLADLRV